MTEAKNKQTNKQMNKTKTCWGGGGGGGGRTKKSSHGLGIQTIDVFTHSSSLFYCGKFNTKWRPYHSYSSSTFLWTEKINPNSTLCTLIAGRHYVTEGIIAGLRTRAINGRVEAWSPHVGKSCSFPSIRYQDDCLAEVERWQLNHSVRAGVAVLTR